MFKQSNYICTCQKDLHTAQVGMRKTDAVHDKSNLDFHSMHPKKFG